MKKYEAVLAQHSTDSCGLELENAMNEAFVEQVIEQLTYEGYEVLGFISIHSDYNIPYLWHIVDKTHEGNYTLDFVFNAKTERIINKFEEVS
ncbi:MAG: hypothetical protein R3Y63_14510 [Eubacteriales bacterium]